MNTIPFIIKKLFQMVENFLLNHCTAKWEGQSTEPQMHPDIPLQLTKLSQAVNSFKRCHRIGKHKGKAQLPG